MFPKKTILPAIIAGTLLGTHAAIPGALADAHNHAENKSSAEAAESQSHKGEDARDDSRSMQEKAEKYGKSTESALEDAWLNGKLDTTLLFADDVNFFAIDTKVKNGVAYLSGSVDSDIDRDLAEEIALSIDGVDSVENALTIKENDDESDNPGADERFRNTVESAALTARIKSELLVNSNVSGLSIDVDSSRDEVTLNGSVDSDASKELAEKIAQNAAGEREVTNNLSVEADS